MAQGLAEALLTSSAYTAAAAVLSVTVCCWRVRLGATEEEADAGAHVFLAAAADGADRPRWRLYQFGPMWGLPTMDPSCLKVQAYMRFIKPSGCLFETNDSGATHISPERTLPVLQDLKSGEIHACAEPIIRHISAAYAAKPVASLTEIEEADATAYTSLVEQHLYNAMLYEWWGCEANYNGITRSAIYSTLPFPLCMYMPYTLRRRHLERIARCRVDTLPRARAVASTCLSALASRLGYRDYFFSDDQPSALDATVYGYLELIRRAPVNEGMLYEELAKHPSLIAFCERIATTYFQRPMPKVGDVPPPPPPPLAPSEDKVAVAHVSPEEQKQKDEAWRWISATAALTVGYVVFSTEWFNDLDDDE